MARKDKWPNSGVKDEPALRPLDRTPAGEERKAYLAALKRRRQRQSG